MRDIIAMLIRERIRIADMTMGREVRGIRISVNWNAELNRIRPNLPVRTSRLFGSDIITNYEGTRLLCPRIRMV